MDSVVVRDLTIRFEEETLFKNVSFSVQKGESVTIVGASGTGKTTLMHVLMGFVPDVSGTIMILGKPLHKKNIGIIRSQIAWVPQEINLPVESAKELFDLPFTFKYNKHLKPDSEEVETILKAFGLPVSILEKAVKDISGGQKQRIVLASCLLLKKPLVLLDEPTAALDPHAIRLVGNYLKKLKDTTVISISHNYEWMQQCDRIIKIDEL